MKSKCVCVCVCVGRSESNLTEGIKKKVKAGEKNIYLIKKFLIA